MHGHWTFFQIFTDIVERLFDYFGRILSELWLLDAMFDFAKDVVKRLLAVGVLRTLENSKEADFALLVLKLQLLTPGTVRISIERVLKTVDFPLFLVLYAKLDRYFVQVIDQRLEVRLHCVLDWRDDCTRHRQIIF